MSRPGRWLPLHSCRNRSPSLPFHGADWIWLCSELAWVLSDDAALSAHPEDSTGLDGGLRALRDQPFGVYLLAAVGAGLICYGVFMMVRAKLAKMNR